MSKILNFIDKVIKFYLGINDEYSIKPVSVLRFNTEIIITYKEKYKRHLHHSEWRDFINNHLKKVSCNDREKLSQSLSKALELDIVIKFKQ